MAGGVPTAKLFASDGVKPPRREAESSFSFVQISDSHIGFNKAANQDVSGTLKLAIARINSPSRDAGLASAYGRRQPGIKTG
jgi:Icc protein